MERFTIDTAPQYNRHYNEDSFWKKLKHLASNVGSKVLYPALQLYFLRQAKNVPMKAKTLIVGALGYLILPVDMVPDFIPALGFTDDLSALMVALRTLNKYLTPEINHKAKEQTNNILKQGRDMLHLS